MMLKATFLDNLSKIRDTNWSHNNLEKMQEEGMWNRLGGDGGV